jgi:hypothetical protein
LREHLFGGRRVEVQDDSGIAVQPGAFEEFEVCLDTVLAAVLPCQKETFFGIAGADFAACGLGLCEVAEVDQAGFFLEQQPEFDAEEIQL